MPLLGLPFYVNFMTKLCVISPGPLLMACGGMLLFGSCCFFAFAFYSVNAEDEEEEEEYDLNEAKGTHPS